MHRARCALSSRCELLLTTAHPGRFGIVKPVEVSASSGMHRQPSWAEDECPQTTLELGRIDVGMHRTNL
jgi:hypothetical protein